MAKSTRIDKYSKYRESIYKMGDARFKTPTTPTKEEGLNPKPPTKNDPTPAIEINAGTMSLEDVIRQHDHLTKEDQSLLSQEEVQNIKKQNNLWKTIGIIASIVIVIFILIAIWAIIKSGGLPT
ncbi:MAG: hypothetical protein EOM74_03780 [Methanomicrobia archaeon]|jgi:hypothetical protein|nr:hypothetical protein [Methanomicrobia archaeon]